MQHAGNRLWWTENAENHPLTVRKEADVAHQWSRLIFLNLPSSIQQDTFRSTLTKPKSLLSCTITDLKLVPKRRFAFVGYKTAEEAQKVKDWFDGTFEFGGGKVKVDFVRDDPLAPAPAKGSKLKSKETDVQTGSNAVAGPSKRLQEFMDVMKGVDPSSSTDSSASTSTANAVPSEQGWVADGQTSTSKKEKSKKGKEKSSEPEEIAEGQGDDDDAAWLRRRQNEALQVEGESFSTKPSPDEDLILSTGRLFIRNLAFIVTSSELSSHFSKYGQIDEIHLPTSSTTGEPLGTAFLQYHNNEDALQAYKNLDKTTFQGRLLHVLPGRPKPGQTIAANGGGVVDGKVLGKIDEQKGQVKKNVDEKRKEDSRKGLNWATLYMNSDAVAASVSSRMGISKSELLNGDSGNAAVKLALAETTVIEETKKYFEDAGIVLEALQPKVPRSQTIILVKNIPFGTTIQSLTDLFASHGKLSRVLLPPFGTLGVVEFENPMDAGKAFRALAYRRLGNAVLYLEKGPVGMFKESPSSAEQPMSTTEKELKEAQALVDKVNEIREEPSVDDEAGSTLFLKNLNFTTTTPRLNAVLASLPGFSFARVQTKINPKSTSGERLSMGYGFVGFKTRQDATKALGALEGFEIDGKVLQVKFAQRGVEDDQKEKDKDKDTKGGNGGKTKSTKLMVKNLPFEISKKEVRELFSAYGQLKSLRLPRKSVPTSTGSASTRGFAFLEFTTHTEALRAMEALKHTHLLGRHLVLEWAKETDDVDVEGLREKVGRDVRFLNDDGASANRKKRKLDFGGKAAEENDGLELD
ncbi:multiple RNA-binding domain-containing protein 1 [Kwoniella mangroviensis CBS 8507]|uniref:multiple RNA-binding domain-containing protein 1 n=1 Tax=Kwoniella mangroviensis CBS 8507 TaxID=1296122 RepID=UPI00080D6B77|nr:multiple RNA-binding domain-containing protein 1 [Kwoniella mangroviensis CBS 8507]OCF65386.1 multiple RNA-binding domain-containing protein 1 [Kwoniella mangroviensis CBS 8507]